MSRLYRENNQDPGRAVFLAGTARSGTTWLADVIASQASCRIMFEPFHPFWVKAYRDFNYFHYARPDEENPALASYARRVLTGNIRDPWIDRQVERLRPDYRLIKAIRANLLLNWLSEVFPEVSIVLIIRHPCAVVSSRMKLGWWTDQDIAPMLSQSKLVEDHLEDKLDLINGAETEEEKHAVIWCIHNLIPLRQFSGQQLSIIFYENLYLQPEIEVPRLFQSVPFGFQSSVYTALNRPSHTSLRSSEIFSGRDLVKQWEKSLTPPEVDRILKVVESFGLDGIYGDSFVPSQGSLENLSL